MRPMNPRPFGFDAMLSGRMRLFQILNQTLGALLGSDMFRPSQTPYGTERFLSGEPNDSDNCRVNPDDYL